MAQKLFSESLNLFAGEIGNPLLIGSLNELKTFLRKKTLKIYTWDENKIAIPLNIQIDLPPLGNHEDIDIKATENVLFVFDVKNYPLKAPTVFTDRLTFPKDKLAHLYIAKNSKPPAFCLVRGNIDEWFANKTIKDLVIRTRNWLRDAAAGELTENGEQFDPLRLEGYRGTIIYKYDEFAGIVHQNKSFKQESDFALCLFENTAQEDKSPAFKIEKIITQDIFKDTFEKYIDSLKKLIENKTFKLKQFHFGFILWSKSQETFLNYSINLPTDWDSFKIFCEKYKIETVKIEQLLSEIKLNFFKEVPIIIAVKRPKNVIGFSSNIEFVNFYIELADGVIKENKIKNNVPVSFQAHNEPISILKAKTISGSTYNLEDSIIVGCGALGSKIIMHFIRNGQTDLTFIDNDNISPHNIVRHALLPEYEGMNKAMALSKITNHFFRFDNGLASIGLPITGNSILSDTFKTSIQKCKWFFDFTASEAFFNTLILTQQLKNTVVCRANITEHGKLGILLIEGTERNPRIDDLQILLYSEYSEYPFISDWLQKESEDASIEKTNIHVGVGCNSETTILSDEIISLHASYFSGVIKCESNNKNENRNGKIYLSRIKSENEFNVETHTFDIEPLITSHALNDPSWEIRIKTGIIESMKREMGFAMPFETGGVFIGCVNSKTKTIHVVDLILAPLDSKSNEICFYRGIHGLPEKVEEINIKTGNQIGYIGEWHTHPFGPNCMSTKDAKTTKDFKKELGSLPSPLPVFLMIVTPSNVLSFVF